MALDLTDPVVTEPAGPVTRRATTWALPQVRRAAAATVLFVAGLIAHFGSGPSWLSWSLFLACYVTGGWEPGWAGLRALRGRTLDVDLLMVAAAIGAAAIGQVLDGGLLIVIFATSGALEAVATHRTAESVRGLLDLAPETATRLSAGGEDVVPTTALQVGDVIVIRPGERIGADGEVVAGASDVDQASITGEGLPVAKVVGDEVFAATSNGAGVLRVRVSKPAHETVVARIVSMVERASATKAKTQLFIEKVEQRYSIGMVVATVALFVIPLLVGAPAQSTLLRAMTFMIVASPCAVVLATMPPLLSAMANAGRHGVLVKSAVVMEELGRTSQVCLDKTGTLTEGTPRVAAVHPVSGSGLSQDALLGLAASAEHGSEHPLATAVVQAAAGRGLALTPATDFAATAGVGVHATVGEARIAVGAPVRVNRGMIEDADVRARVVALEQAGHTAVLVTRDTVSIGVLGIADRLRPDAAAIVTRLAQLTGMAPVLLTGDNPRAAATLGAEVGITDIQAGLLPQDKVDAIAEMQATGARVLLVGDGINDAPALAAADTGIAMGKAGSDLTLDTADAIIVRDELATIPAIIGLSRRARRLIAANLLIAATIITGLVLWDLIGHLPLPLGVAGHEGSTVIVGLNGLRLLRTTAWRRSLRPDNATA